MKKRLLFTPIFIVTFLTALALLSISPAHKSFADGPSYYNLADYYPLTQGSTWTYQWAENGYSGVGTQSIDGFKKIKGVKTAKRVEEDGGYACQAFDSGGLKEYGWGEPPFIYGVYSLPYNPLPAQMYVGQTHRSAFVEKLYNQEGQLMSKSKGILSVTLDGLEDLSVGAGDFTCLKFSLSESWQASNGWSGFDTTTFWLANGVGLVKEIWTERWYDDQGQLIGEASGTDELIDYDISPNDSTLTSPNGGNTIPSGSPYTVEWTAFPGAASYKLQYSMNNGKKWESIAEDVTGNDYDWTVPTVPKNKTRCLVKVIGYDDSGKKLGADRSDWTSTIEVVKVVSPDGGETLTSGGTYTITWQTNGTMNPIDQVKLLYTKNGGKTWKSIDTLTENTGSYDWTVPDVPKKKKRCRVKVVLKDSNGKTVGSDTSDGYFTIEP